jgi:hypothetical protein
LFSAGLVRGTGDGSTFSPAGTLTRQQGAALIARLARSLNDLERVEFTDLGVSTVDRFTDDDSSTLEQDINDLAAVG